MSKPCVYIHRIGQLYNEYMTRTNEESLNSFAEVISDGPMVDKPSSEHLAKALKGAHAIISLNGVGAEDLTESLVRDAGTIKVAVIAHYWLGSHSRASAGWRNAGVTVIDASDGNNRAVAEWTLGAAITGMYRFAEFDRAMKSGVYWPDKSVTDMLEGKVLGIVGLGRVGRIVARYFRVFDMKIIGYDAYVPDNDLRLMGVEPVSLMDLLSQSDIITFHLPLTNETVGMIGRKELQAIKDGSLVINSARAAIMDSEAFREELKKKRFRAVLDVFDPEPPPLDDEIRKLDNVVMTPHIAGDSKQMRADCGKIAIQALKQYFST